MDLKRTHQRRRSVDCCQVHSDTQGSDGHVFEFDRGVFAVRRHYGFDDSEVAQLLPSSVADTWNWSWSCGRMCRRGSGSYFCWFNSSEHTLPKTNKDPENGTRFPLQTSGFPRSPDTCSNHVYHGLYGVNAGNFFAQRFTGPKPRQEFVSVSVTECLTVSK